MAHSHKHLFPLFFDTLAIVCNDFGVSWCILLHLLKGFAFECLIRANGSGSVFTSLWYWFENWFAFGNVSLYGSYVCCLRISNLAPTLDAATCGIFKTYATFGCLQCILCDKALNRWAISCRVMETKELTSTSESKRAVGFPELDGSNSPLWTPMMVFQEVFKAQLLTLTQGK